MKNFPKSLLLFLILSLFFCCFIPLTAQKQGKALIDSLLIELPKAKEDTNKVNILNSLSFEYYFMNYQEGIRYGEMGLKLAQILNWKKGISTSYNVIARNYLNINSNKVIDYLNKALKIAIEIKDYILISKILSNLGNGYTGLSDFTKALEYYNKSLRIDLIMGRKFGIACNLNNIGNIYFKKADYTNALKYYYNSIQIFEELDDNNIAKGILMNIGDIYKDYHKNFNKALIYYNKSLEIAEKTGDKGLIAQSLCRIGTIYGFQMNLAKAFEYGFKALKTAEEVGDKMTQFSINIYIGEIYQAQSDYSKKLEYLQKALKLANELDDKHLVSDAIGELGCLYYLMAMDTLHINEANKNESTKIIYFRKAVMNLEECINLHKEIGMCHSEMNFLKYLYATYIMLGNYKKALLNYADYHILKDSLFNFEKSKEIGNIEANYKVEKKEKELQIVKKDNQLKELIIQQDETFRSYLIVITILIILLAIGTFNRYRYKKKQNIALEEKNIQLNNANKEIDRFYKEKIKLQEEAHDKESQIMMLTNEKLQTDLDLKRKELTALAINLVDKNEYLIKLKEHAEQIGKAKPEEVGPMVRMIIRSININARGDEAWQVFETQFKAIHRGFIEFISSKYPSLTVTETKVCALLKINLSSKEISSLLNLSLRTVEDHRLNIRKKMGLDKDVNLNQYIAQLSY
jgi:tetratricopeptide (TPR) repeat protein/DNA-binding CsgD family transcriptional regulator